MELPTIAALGGAGGLAAIVWQHRRRRRRLYAALASQRAARLAGSLRPGPLAPFDDALVSRFARERIAIVDNFLAPEDCRRLAVEGRANITRQERNYVPGHKQGGTLAYAALHEHAPACLSLYHWPVFHWQLSALVGEPVVPTADHDQSSCSLLYYSRAGDRIGWHFDHNFYRGRHFTVLLCLVNETDGDALSASRLHYRALDGVQKEVAMPPGSLVVFEGARIRHCVSAIGASQLRIVLSMTFATDPRVAFGREWIRRIKDTAFYGPRALWD